MGAQLVCLGLTYACVAFMAHSQMHICSHTCLLLLMLNAIRTLLL